MVGGGGGGVGGVVVAANNDDVDEYGAENARGVCRVVDGIVWMCIVSIGAMNLACSVLIL